ncbi:Dyp-type peroxidase [Weissella confusa]|uniref:Dyp-type peroxidase n=1 Tax=Weissella confusa TaxID=1583 RepID=A0A923NGK1_WEICO|nr:Dyp-type peroxidase [Weissella confusa]
MNVPFSEPALNKTGTYFDVTTVIDETKGFRNFEGRAIIGFIDGTEVPSAADSAEVAVVGDEDPEFVNGSYAFAQKWLHDMDF